ncbi:MAG TPA: alternative ribosome rescue aminoacyl-tRNA hydrolase ArfB [Bacteroidales bacterium]|nr:alternative ribosome rescue aminoacyl-tRNA hydrolase ArfB [Bacteroidales bacterium]
MDTAETDKLLENIRNYELSFAASRSSGPGGQHANKVSTKVEVRFHILQSTFLSDEQKQFLVTKLASKLTNESELIVTSQDSRSQSDNKEKASEKLLAIIQKVLTPPKQRKPTKPSPAAKAKRLESKRKQAEKKENRKGPKI